MTPGKPLLVGLTGGIGSGKSTVLRLLREEGCETVLADLLAREAVAPGSEGLARVVETFGTGMLTPEGALDRKAMARLVFAEAEARRNLEGIVHPLVLAGEERAIAAWEERGRPSPLVVEFPLLLEMGRQYRYDLVILVTCPREVRLNRLQEAGMDAKDAEARMAAQWPEKWSVPLAGHVIDNSGDMACVERQVAVLLPRLWGNQTHFAPDP